MQRITIKLLLYLMLFIGIIDINVLACVAFATFHLQAFAILILSGFIGTILSAIGIEKIYGSKE